MKMIRNILLGILLLISILMLLLRTLFAPESKFLLSPHIDTRFGKDFKIQHFEMVTVGYDTSETIRILGEPFSKTYDKKTKTYNYWYSLDGKCSWWDFAWESFSIYYDSSGNFIYKNRCWYYD